MNYENVSRNKSVQCTLVKPVLQHILTAELQKVLTFRIANLPDYRRVALQTFRIANGLLSFFKTFRVALLPRYPGFCDSGQLPVKNLHQVLKMTKKVVDILVFLFDVICMSVLLCS